MRFAILVGVLAAGAVSTGAPIPKDKEKPKDEAAIQGTWRLDQFEGPDGPPAALGAVLFTLREGTLTVSFEKQPAMKPGSYTIDPTAKPKSIDLKESGGRLAPGIYELDGDTLRMCVAEGKDAARPTEFKADQKKMVAVVTFKRVPDKKDK